MMKIISLRYFRTNFPLVTQLRFRPLMTRFKQEVGAVVSLVAVGVEDVTEEVALLAGEVEGSLEGPTVQLEPIQAYVTVLTLEISIEIFHLKNGDNCPTLSEILFGTLALKRRPAVTRPNFVVSQRLLHIITLMILAQSRAPNKPKSHKIWLVEVLVEMRIKVVVVITPVEVETKLNHPDYLRFRAYNRVNDVMLAASQKVSLPHRILYLPPKLTTTPTLVVSAQILLPFILQAMSVKFSHSSILTNH